MQSNPYYPYNGTKDWNNPNYQCIYRRDSVPNNTSPMLGSPQRQQQQYHYNTSPNKNNHAPQYNKYNNGSYYNYYKNFPPSFNSRRNSINKNVSPTKMKFNSSSSSPSSPTKSMANSVANFIHIVEINNFNQVPKDTISNYQNHNIKERYFTKQNNITNNTEKLKPIINVVPKSNSKIVIYKLTSNNHNNNNNKSNALGNPKTKKMNSIIKQHLNSFNIDDTNTCLLYTSRCV